MKFAPILALLAIGCASDTSLLPEDKPAAPKPTPDVRAETVRLNAGGSTVFADLYSAKQTSKVILMFHQAGSNAKEYETIAPRLAAIGYDCLAVDLRCGGTMWGAKNRTGNSSGPYISAYSDMVAALDWAKTKYKMVAVIGSSYSACLALKLGAEYPDIKAIAAFSPGEYFPNKRQVKDWNSSCRVPVLMAMTQDEQLEGGLTLYQSGAGNPERSRGDMILSFPDSVHGASTLREDKNPKGAKKYMQGLIAFLNRHVR